MPEASEILTIVSKDKQKGIYFLDIELGDDRKKEGIYLGEKIRQYDPDGYIIYITSHSELSMMVLRHKVAATDFIPKDETEHIKKNIADIEPNHTRWCVIAFSYFSLPVLYWQIFYFIIVSS